MISRLITVSCFLLCKAAVASTHCMPSEKVLFSCQVEGSKKLASVCASGNFSKTTGYVQYRFGRLEKIELVYPPTKTGSQERFFWRELRPYQSSVRELTFRNGGYYYTLSIYDISEEINDIPGGAQFGQIEIEKLPSKNQSKILKCAGYPEGDFHLGEFVKDGDDLIGK